MVALQTGSRPPKMKLASAPPLSALTVNTGPQIRFSSGSARSGANGLSNRHGFAAGRGRGTWASAQARRL
jgi:hypothetical protein